MRVGAEIKLCRPFDDKHPVLLGRLGRNPDRPTICFYGHYGQSWRPFTFPDAATFIASCNALFSSTGKLKAHCLHRRAARNGA